MNVIRARTALDGMWGDIEMATQCNDFEEYLASAEAAGRYARSINAQQLLRVGPYAGLAVIAEIAEYPFGQPTAFDAIAFRVLITEGLDIPAGEAPTRHKRFMEMVAKEIAFRQGLSDSRF